MVNDRDGAQKQLEVVSDAKMLLSLGMLMLSATQIYTIFTVQIFAFLNLLPVEADIAAVSKTNNLYLFILLDFSAETIEMFDDRHHNW